MASFKITGGHPLYGSVRLGGAKNASFKLMIAGLLGENESRLLNFSRIGEIDTVAGIIESLGGKVSKRGERTLFIYPQDLREPEIPDRYGPTTRSTPMFLPVLLHKFKFARVPNPGGDKIGKRPLGRHFEALEEMGAKVIQTETHIEAKAEKLFGTRIKFDKNSHTGTETVLMAAVKAEGTTVIENAALEPEVDDLIQFLNEMGGRIRRRHNRVIEVEGVKELNGAIHRIMPDRNEAVSYACAALATKGDIVVENARPEHLEAFLEKTEEAGGGFEVGNYGIRFFYKGPLRAVDIMTQPHPGFMTDWQPLIAVLLTQAEGKSIIHEAVFPSRFQYFKELLQMGAKVKLFQPEVDRPEKFYNFDLNEENNGVMHAAEITGPTPLNAGEFKVVDLRHGATLVIAAMIAPGTSLLTDIEQVDRGYEDFDERLRSMGAEIVRQD